MKKLLIGGSPCTYWSIAQTVNRETQANGIGWELFKNFLIAKEKFQPDFFLYENNKSAAQPIKDQISLELGVPLMYINSALVSAQQRQRFYAFNWIVEQPPDRGIVLRDILEYGTPWNDKAYCLTATYNGAVIKDTLTKKRRTMVAEPLFSSAPIRLGKISNSQGDGIYSINGKSICICANGDTGYYAYVPEEDKTFPVYEVINGFTEIRGRSCPIKLPDGLYVVRKLTPSECERLQTLPDNYTEGVSKTQRYKALGNGWTAEVIIHILNGALKNLDRGEQLVVLSMYDGIATGRYCLDKMGFYNVTYYAYEIDKFAIKIAAKNYPDIIERGDAFDLRNPNWNLDM